ncbi:MAG TPA: hypothetical protein VK488_13245 [Gaiellaceae bacterium]|nr:hypothetical protein [Gaiellaceae bacterium]
MKRLAVVFATLPLALAACGAAEVAPPSGREQVALVRQVPFAPQAAAICKGMQRGAGVVSSGRKRTDAEFGRLLSRWRIGFDRLARLDPPAGRAKAFNQMLRQYRTMVSALAAAKAADDESVLGDIAVAVVEGTRGSRAARRAGLPGCAFLPEIKQPPRDPEPVLAATRALVLPGMRIVKADTPACNKEASCRIEFLSSGSTAVRLRSALALLRAHGWTHARTGRSPTGSSWAIAYRNDYEVEVELLGKRRPPHCVGARPVIFRCSDAVWVHRVEIPDVLTGG